MVPRENARLYIPGGMYGWVFFIGNDMIETYHFSLGEENFTVPSTVGYNELITTLGIATIDLILAAGSNSSWDELFKQSKNVRQRGDLSTPESYIAHTIIQACKQLSVSQGRFSITRME